MISFGLVDLCGITIGADLYEGFGFFDGVAPPTQVEIQCDAPRRRDGSERYWKCICDSQVDLGGGVLL